MKSVTVLMLLSLIYSAPLFAEGMTKEQGDAILRELRAIRQEVQDLRKQVAAAVQPDEPRQPRTAKVSTLGDPVLGDVKAPITLVEFTDFQCPYCRRFFSDTLSHLRKDYIATGKLRLVLVDLPLDFHSDARLAARAAHCAGEQDKYWQMHDAMFSSRYGIKRDQLLAMAKKIGLDRKPFESCLNSKRYDRDIAQDIVEANKISISGTPSFIIGKTTDNMVEGKIIRGAQPLANFVNEIEALSGSGE